MQDDIASRRSASDVDDETSGMLPRPFDELIIGYEKTRGAHVDYSLGTSTKGQDDFSRAYKTATKLRTLSPTKAGVEVVRSLCDVTCATSRRNFDTHNIAHGEPAIMRIESIVEFWRGQQDMDDAGQWAHRLDRQMLSSFPHSFNLDHPVSPYVGDVLHAPVVILGANAGYSSTLTPTEFPDAASVEAYLSRVNDPSGADWSFVSRYYNRANYGHFVARGEAVVVNACAYRSPKISDRSEAANRSLIKTLPSAVFTRRWLIEAVLPMAANGERLIVAKRPGLWKLPPTFASAKGVVVDPAPVSPQITGVPFRKMTDFLGVP